MIVSLSKLGEALGISKQAVAKVHGKYLIKNDKGKIEIDNPINKRYLESKGIVLSQFGVKIRKVKQTPPETLSKPPEFEHIDPETETLPVQTTLAKLDIQLKLESIKSKRATTELNKLKIEEANGKLIGRDIAEKLINDSVGAIIQSFITLPSSVVDIILSIYEANPDNRREKIVQLLQDRYTKESKKIVETAQRKYMKEIEDQMKRAENEQTRH